jgi:hypothetical protein
LEGFRICRTMSASDREVSVNLESAVLEMS